MTQNIILQGMSTGQTLVTMGYGGTYIAPPTPPPPVITHYGYKTKRIVRPLKPQLPLDRETLELFAQYLELKLGE